MTLFVLNSKVRLYLRIVQHFWNYQYVFICRIKMKLQPEDG